MVVWHGIEGGLSDGPFKSEGGAEEGVSVVRMRSKLVEDLMLYTEEVSEKVSIF